MVQFGRGKLSPAKQRGEMNFGTLILVLLLIFCAVTVMKLWTPFFEDLAVKTTLKNIASEPVTSTMGPKEIRSTINKRLQVNSVEGFKDHEVLIRKEQGEIIIDITYERRVPMYGNVDVVIKFHHNAVVE